MGEQLPVGGGSSSLGIITGVILGLICLAFFVYDLYLIKKEQKVSWSYWILSSAIVVLSPVLTYLVCTGNSNNKSRDIDDLRISDSTGSIDYRLAEAEAKLRADSIAKVMADSIANAKADSIVKAIEAKKKAEKKVQPVSKKYYYVVVASFESPDSAIHFNMNGPADTEYGRVYVAKSKGHTVYRVCTSCSFTKSEARRLADKEQDLLNLVGFDIIPWIWVSDGPAECIQSAYSANFCDV